MSQPHLNMSRPVVKLPRDAEYAASSIFAPTPPTRAPTRDWLTGRATPAFVDDRASVVAFAPVGEGRVEALPGDEFLILLSGTLTVESARGVTVITTGRSAVLPAGLSFGWRAAAGTIAIIVACPAVGGRRRRCRADRRGCVAPAVEPTAC